MLLLERPVFLDECVDPVNHTLYKFHLGVTQSVLVRDIVGDTGLSAGLATGPPRLDLQLLASGLECREPFLGVAGQIHVHRGAHARAEVGGAGVDEAILGVQHELTTGLLPDTVSHRGDTPSQPGEYSLDIAAHLHGDYAELVLLVDPGEESLVLVMEDTSTLGPVALHTGGL